MKKTTEPPRLSNVEIERFDDCKHYNGCLATAAYNFWPSFSCSSCKKYCPTTKFQPDKLSRVATPLADTFI